MPLSELYRVTTSTKPEMNASRSSDLPSSFLPNSDEFVELLWENGQIVMHGQSSRPTKKITTPFSVSCNDVQSHECRAQFPEKYNTNATFSLFPKIPSFGSVDPLTDPDFTEPKSGIGLSSHDEDSINCSIDESLCSELLSDLNQIDHLVNPSSDKPFSRRSVPMLKLKNTDLTTQQHDLPPVQNKPNGSASSTMNFSHFARPVAKAGLPSEERLNNEKTTTSHNNNLLESTIVQSSGCYGSISMAQQMPTSLPTIREQPSFQNEILTNDNFGKNKSEKEKPKEKAKGAETVVPSSSVCSDNLEPKCGLKRKNREEDAGICDREDLEESVELKKPNSSKATGIKRSRTAEVHNLSERRRRDRINEKMRALQELIPNCNNVDKASMLDEAIEYLKSLQLQVQMMATSTGFCMPPMMLPPAMHHMRLPPPLHMPLPFLHMGFGMGYGMGMLDLNGYPAIPPPIMHGGRNVHNSGIPMFGFPPPPVVTSNKENAGQSCSQIDSAPQRENAQVESG